MIKKIKIKLIDIRLTKKNIHWSKNQLDMIDDISNYYDENISLITVNKDNEIIDGHHRHKILCDKFGGNYEITVRKINVSKNVYDVAVLSYSLIILVLLLPVYLIFGIFNVIIWCLKKIKKKYLTKQK